MSFLDDWKDAKPATSRDGEFFAGPNDSGTATLIDAQVFKGNDDAHTYKLTFDIKDSQGPNAAGTRRVVIKKLDSNKYEKSFAKTQVAGLVGIDPESPKMGETFQGVFRLDANGHTQPNTKCPLAGMDYKFTVGPVKTKAGTTIAVPNFSPAAEGPAMKEIVAANKARLGL